jgi:hypothetical protein
LLWLGGRAKGQRCQAQIFFLFSTFFFIKLIINEAMNKLLKLEYRQQNVGINIPLILKK